MQNGRINRWVAVAGFAVLAVGLGLEGVALYETYADTDRTHPNDRPSLERPEPMMRLLFDRTG
jgi:hypothetical protein